MRILATQPTVSGKGRGRRSPGRPREEGKLPGCQGPRTGGQGLRPPVPRSSRSRAVSGTGGISEGRAGGLGPRLPAPWSAGRPAQGYSGERGREPSGGGSPAGRSRSRRKMHPPHRSPAPNPGSPSRHVTRQRACGAACGPGLGCDCLPAQGSRPAPLSLPPAEPSPRASFPHRGVARVSRLRNSSGLQDTYRPTWATRTPTPCPGPPPHCSTLPAPSFLLLTWPPHTPTNPSSATPWRVLSPQPGLPGGCRVQPALRCRPRAWLTCTALRAKPAQEEGPTLPDTQRREQGCRGGSRGRVCC